MSFDEIQHDISRAVFLKIVPDLNDPRFPRKLPQDTGFPQEEVFRFLYENDIRADLVSMDGTFADDPTPHSNRHMDFSDNVRLRETLFSYGIADKNTRFIVTHFTHNSVPFRDRIGAVAAGYSFLAAYDGLEIEI